MKVPSPFVTPFLRAQEYVARYFADRIEQPDTATIAIAGERYVLLRAASLSVEFVEMVMKLYQDKGTAEARSVANNLLFDLAHALGKADARSFQQKMAVSDPIDNLSAGPIHFAFSGWAFVDISEESRPSPDENYFLLYDHPFSFESHSWLAKGKRSDVPVCIMNAGYSSGWCEESFGLPLAAAEVECLASGGRHCRFIMAPPSRLEAHLAEYAARHGGATSAALHSMAAVVPEFFQRKRLEDELKKANEQLEQRVKERTAELETANRQLGILGSAIENALEGFVILETTANLALRISFVNQGFCRITGYCADEMLNQPPEHLVLVDNAMATWASLYDSVRRDVSFEAEVTARRPDGSTYALEIHLMPVRSGGRTAHWIAILRDISDRKLHLDQLQHQAMHDALTGLPNRLLLHERIEQRIHAMRRQGTPFALLLLDLDGFKEINDTFGHYTGDVLLSKVGERLRAQLGATDTIARLGGDEFAIVLTEVVDRSHVIDFVCQLLVALKQPIFIEEHKLVVGASIGIVHCPEHGTDATTLMRRADVAMYAAKAARSGSMTYDARHDVHSPARIQLINELRGSIDNEHLSLHYQPEIDLATGRVIRVEALLRWQRPDGSRLLPDEFLPLVESSETIDRISRWVLDKAVADCREWQEAGIAAGVSVNLSPHNLHDDRLGPDIATALVKHGLAPSQLTVEITESGILGDIARATRTFQHLRDLGVGVSIDDFGTGYSSLLHLKHLPFTELKIDRSFTNEMLANAHDAAIVRSIIDLCHELGRAIVAEGVETQEVLDRLVEYGCDIVQGYYVSRPLDKSTLHAWLRQAPQFSREAAMQGRASPHP
ncbi:EAL domain-containing protein [Tahibacter amnicola]|uniref:EAL domain-containing protein n=1 Tax=Tahibacter amnicola TaxID=2976241 RepID=A0ABY6BA87_9GAMM|nr:EAL domain-containing protein [Tahibacter amnicola]UXI66451.1 EAL domain-containing protein [Tahibacter amnicola]